MTDHPSRHYTDKEVSLILRRATELQRAAPSSANPIGLTLAELEEIAREAGIEVDLLRQAATEVDVSRPSGLGEVLTGGPITIRLERTVPGELSENAMAELVPAIQMAADAPGQASAVGRTLTWSSGGGQNTRSMQVLIACRDGETLIRLEERLGSLVGGLFGGLVGGGGAGTASMLGPLAGAITGSAIITTGVVVMAVGGMYSLARTIFRRKSASRRRALDALMFAIVERVERSVAKLPPEGTIR